MHIEYRISEKDYRAAAMLAMRKRSSGSSIDYYGPYVFGVIWIAASVIPNPLNGYLSGGMDSLMTFGVVPIVVGFLLMRRKGIKQDYLKLKNFQMLQVVDIDSGGLRIETSAGVTRSAWKIYSKFAEDPKCFIIFQHSNHTIIPVPKGELTLVQIDELRSLLAARLPVA